MKFILVGVFVFFFVVLPMYLLNSVVMPQLQTVKQTYVNAGNIANAAAGVTAQNQ